MLEHFEAGNGTLVAAMHPAASFGQSTAELLAGACGGRVICVNPPEQGGVDVMVDALEAFRQERGFPAWTFWGLSGGGFLGLVYAHRHPAALRSLVIESACACFQARLADPACLLSPANPAWAAPLSSGPLAIEADGWAPVDGVGSVYAPEGRPLFVAPTPIDARMRAAIPGLLAFDARPYLDRIQVPTLVIQGADDAIAPTSHARALFDALPNARWLEIPDAGHVPSANGNAVAHAAVRDFLGERS